MRSVLVISMALALGACVEDPMVEDPGEEAAEDLGKADAATLPLRFLPGELILPSANVRTEVRKVFRTEADLEAALGIDNPGIDFTREWGVFFAPGSAALTPGAMARIETVSLSSTGLTIKVDTAVEHNGAGCPTRRTRPFLLVAVPIPDEVPPYTKTYRTDRTRACAEATYLDGVPFTAAQVAASLRACNLATSAQLAGAGITGTQASIITSGRTWSSLSLVSSTGGIGQSTMLKLRTLGASF